MGNSFKGEDKVTMRQWLRCSSLVGKVRLIKMLPLPYYNEHLNFFGNMTFNATGSYSFFIKSGESIFINVSQSTPTDAIFLTLVAA